MIGVARLAFTQTGEENRHALYDLVIHDERPYLIHELVEGETLDRATNELLELRKALEDYRVDH